MALDKSIIDIPLAGGLDTRTDAKQVLPGTLLAAENVVIRNSGALAKRYGYTHLSQSLIVVHPNTDGIGVTVNRQMDAGLKLMTYKDQLVMIGHDAEGASALTESAGPQVYARMQSSGAWCDVGRLDPLDFKVNRISLSDEDIVNGVSMAEGNLYRLYAWEASSNVHYRIHDKETGALILDDLIGSNTSMPKCLFVSASFPSTNVDTLIIGYHQTGGTGVRFRRFGEGAITTTLSAVTYGNPTVQHMWDCCAIPLTSGFAATEMIEGLGIHVRTFDRSITTKQSLTIVASASNCLSIFPITPRTGAPQLCIAYQSGGLNTLHYRLIPTDLSSVGTAYTLSASTPGETIRNITGIMSPEAGGTSAVGDPIRFFVECSASVPQSASVVTVAHNTSGSALGTYHRMRGVGLASHAFLGNNRSHVLCVHESALQSTYFLKSLNGRTDSLTDAVMFYGRAGGLGYRNGQAARVIDSGTIRIPILRQDRLLQDGKIEKSVNELILNFSASRPPHTYLGDRLYVGGGYLGHFDGTYQEAGFFTYPETLKVVSSASSGGNISGSGPFNYIAVGEWTDKSGDVYRSALSTALTGVIPGHGTATQTITIQIPAINEISKNKSLPGWINLRQGRVRLYRTEAGGTRYYKTSTTANVENNKDTDFVNQADATADSALSDNEELYAQDGILENFPCPSPFAMGVVDDRLFVIPQEQRTRLIYSKKKQPGLGIEFNPDFLYLDVEQDGDGVAIGNMDGNGVLFKSKAIYIVTGEGLNAVGAGTNYTARRLTSDVGITDRDSLIEFPDGLLFKSQKGFYLLDRTFQLSYIGSMVQQYNNYSVLSAVRIDKLNQIRFSLSDNQPTLVFDYLERKWSTFTNHNAVDAAIWNGNYCWLSGSGVVAVEKSGTFTDNGNSYSMMLDTGWLKFAGLQGFQRVWSIGVLGEHVTDHVLTASFYYDYKTTSEESLYFYTADRSDKQYDFRFRQKRQQCEAIRLRITEAASSGSQESATWSTISCAVGIKKGANQLPYNKKA